MSWNLRNFDRSYLLISLEIAFELLVCESEKYGCVVLSEAQFHFAVAQYFAAFVPKYKENEVRK